MQPRIPPPILMLLGAGLMWALDHWMSLGQWMSAPWNRLGGLVAPVGIAIAVAAFVRFRKAGTTVARGASSFDGQTASGPILAMTADLCPSFSWAKMTPEGTNGHSRARSWLEAGLRRIMQAAEMPAGAVTCST